MHQLCESINCTCCKCVCCSGFRARLLVVSRYHMRSMVPSFTFACLFWQFRLKYRKCRVGMHHKNVKNVMREWPSWWNLAKMRASCMRYTQAAAE